MGKCIKCGKPTSLNSDLCGFCKITPIKEIVEEKRVEPKKVFKEYDKVKVVVKKQEVEKSFDRYDDVKVVEKKKKSDTDVDTILSVRSLMDSSNSYSYGIGLSIGKMFSPIMIGGIIALIYLTMFGSIESSLNKELFNPSVLNMMNLIPLVLVGAAIVGIISVAFGISGSEGRF